jgi:hypothetical protein
LIVVGIAVVVVSAFALAAARPAEAQCGSQASSCKNCHETQGKMSVNADGTGWHESHAFGDFCYICHGGNSQATDEVAAHTGMVSPMADIQVACGQCHPNDLQARADVYAAKLGIPAGGAVSPQPSSKPTAAPTAVLPGPTEQAVAPQAAVVAPNDPNLVDYVARYNQDVLKQKATNWGNIILIALLVLLLLGGALFVNRREGWVSISFTEKKPLGKEYAEDVAGIADQAARLSPDSRKALSRLLDRPAALGDLLSAIDRLSTDVESVDKE